MVEVLAEMSEREKDRHVAQLESLLERCEAVMTKQAGMLDMYRERIKLVGFEFGV